MTITITNPDGTTNIGLGSLLNLSSTHGSVPAGSTWVVQVGLTSGFTSPTFQLTNPVSTLSDQIEVGTFLSGQSYSFFTAVGANVEEGPAYVQATMQQPGVGVIDSGSATMTWKISQYQNKWLQEQIQFYSGLRGSQATQLNNIQTTVSDIQNQQMIPVTGTEGTTSLTIGEFFATKLIDILTTATLTSGPTTGSFSHLLLSGETGIIIHIDTIPDWYGFAGPGEGYYEPALAKVRVYRGGDVMFDQLIHEPDTLIYPIPGAWNVSPSSFFSIQVIPPNMSLSVDFNDGVAGEVSVMLFP